MSRPSSIPKSRRGAFSLVEVMVAIAILSIALVGMTQGLTTALQSNKEAEWTSVAALIAEARVEFLRADGYLIEGVTEGALSGELTDYSWQETLTQTEIEGLYEVELEVTHTDTHQRLYLLKTMLFDPPVLGVEGAVEQEPDPRDPNSRTMQGL